MRNPEYRRSRARKKNTLLISSVALALGSGVLVAVNVSANASNADSSPVGTITCPTVADKLPAIPQQAQAEVQRNLDLLDKQIDEANRRLASTRDQGGPNFVQNAILQPLADKRKATIDRITIAIGRVATRPTGLDDLATCTLTQTNTNAGRTADQGGNGGTGNQLTAVNTGQTTDAGGGQNSSGLSADDFVDITKVPANVKKVRNRQGASTGTFASRCGTKTQGQNSDNVIVAPGVANGAHHMHDYVGNKKVNAFSTNDSLAAQGTTCTNGDQSTYYWPVLRDRTQQGLDANVPGGGLEGNIGKILVPATVTITFKGSPTGKVTAMPRFLRIITGDAKAFTNGTANANAHWSCTSFENKVQLTDKYPICPSGSKVVRSFAFQSCWDGRDIDSANHRTHVAFTDADGDCPGGFKAIPQLTMRLTYKTPAAPDFAVDTFPEQLHKPITDHDDFINVMSDKLMRQAVNCINSGQKCG
jgi:Domain of unknown function (DUF1996)